MTRSIWKGPFVKKSTLDKTKKANETNSHKPIKIWTRSSTILPSMVGLTFSVHNGKDHIPVFISDHMIGHKFGEFALTRTFRAHAGAKVVKK
ncbi:MAG: 30S ribosomal protein S19 [Alphaproteobacteria bacterium]|nr:30S ribosomal protein S19 [Alphaproteobacteria bacterium]MBL0718169.1 30S ribosomal protein S19 [Alphaproteobacteria bacterium]